MTVENVYDPTYEDATAAASAGVMATERAAAQASAGLEEALKAGNVKPTERREGTFVFVAPVQRNTSYLINPTERKINSIVDPNSPTGKRQMSTENDVWVKFADGIVMIDATTEEGQKQLAWAIGHPEICRDINEPMTAAWVQMKEAQTQTSRREASLPTGLDVDRLLSGDPGAQRSGNVTADRARHALDSVRAGA